MAAQWPLNGHSRTSIARSSGGVGACRRSPACHITPSQVRPAPRQAVGIRLAGRQPLPPCRPPQPGAATGRRGLLRHRQHGRGAGQPRFAAGRWAGAGRQRAGPPQAPVAPPGPARCTAVAGDGIRHLDLLCDPTVYRRLLSWLSPQTRRQGRRLGRSAGAAHGRQRGRGQAGTIRPCPKCPRPTVGLTSRQPLPARQVRPMA